MNVKSGDGISTSPLLDLGEHVGEGALGRVERAVGEVGPGAFLRHQRRERRVHPPERQLQVFFERGLAACLGLGAFEGKRGRAQAGHRPGGERDAEAEDEPDRARGVSWRLLRRRACSPGRGPSARFAGFARSSRSFSRSRAMCMSIVLVVIPAGFRPHTRASSSSRETARPAWQAR